MNIIIKTKNIELTKEVEAFVIDKVGKLERFLPEKDVEVFVELEKETVRHRQGDVFLVEIVLELPGKKLIARSTGSDWESIVIEAKDEMEVMVKKYKTKRIDEPRRKMKKATREVEES